MLPFALSIVCYYTKSRFVELLRALGIRKHIVMIPYYRKVTRTAHRHTHKTRCRKRYAKQNADIDHIIITVKNVPDPRSPPSAPEDARYHDKIQLAGLYECHNILVLTALQHPMSGQTTISDTHTTHLVQGTAIVYAPSSSSICTPSPEHTHSDTNKHADTFMRPNVLFTRAQQFFKRIIIK